MESLPFSPTLGGKPLKRWKMEIWRRDKEQRYYYSGYNMAEWILFFFFFNFLPFKLVLSPAFCGFCLLFCFSQYPRFQACGDTRREDTSALTAWQHVTHDRFHRSFCCMRTCPLCYIPVHRPSHRRAIKKHRQLLLPRVWFPIIQITRVCGRVYCPHVQLNSGGLCTSRLHEQICDLVEHDSSLVRSQLSTLSSQEIVDGMPVAESLTGKNKLNLLQNVFSMC